MKKIVHAAVCGLLWLAFSTAVFGAASFTLVDQTYSIDRGGQFLAYLNGNSSNTFFVYCADYLNTVNVPVAPNPGPSETFSVNIDTPTLNISSIADTRYGTTPASAFTTQKDSNNQVIGSALDRYLMAAWLTTQYTYGPGDNLGMNDISIQNAIWTLLDADGSVHIDGGATNVANWLDAAKTWELNAIITNTLASFASRVEIFSSVNIASDSIPQRYTDGNQEMITVTGSPVPEPQTLAFMGFGLLAVGLLRWRKKA